MASVVSVFLLFALFSLSNQLRVRQQSQSSMLIQMMANHNTTGTTNATTTSNLSNPSVSPTNPTPSSPSTSQGSTNTTTTVIVLKTAGNKTVATTLTNAQTPVGNQTIITNQNLGNPANSNFTAVWNTFINSALQNTTNPFISTNVTLNTTLTHNQTEKLEKLHKEGSYVPKSVILDAFDSEFRAKGGYRAMMLYHQTLYNVTMQYLFDSIDNGLTHLNYQYPGPEAQKAADLAFKKAGGLQAYESAFEYAFGVAYNTTGKAIKQ